MSASPSRRYLGLALVALALIVILALAYGLKGSGLLHRLRGMLGMLPKPPAAPLVQKVPSLASLHPADAATGVDPAAPILINLELPNAPLDPATISDDSVGVFRFTTRQRVPAKVEIVPEGLRVTPSAPLDANANYRVHLLPGVKDQAGFPLKQLSYAFFTSSKPAPGVAFDRVDMPAAVGEGFTALNFGPDGKLYAATHEGKLVRFTVGDDGILSNKEVFTTLMQAEQGPRLFTGFTFGPESTAQSPVIYLTHSEFGFEEVADFTGKISRISGPLLDKYEALVINLPRSIRDHATNQPSFGPDGALYIPQPSNTAVGAPDAFWGMREEHRLNATILRLDVKALKPGQVIDARTTDAGGSYDPYAAGAPLTIYAHGLRMPYDLIWHSNGQLYTGVNGAAARGATPAGTDLRGTSVPGIARVDMAEHDWFFRIEQGRYYGHPNPKQGRLVLNGGNPTKGPDFNEVADYPAGVMPDPDYVSAEYDLGMHISANGLTEYRSNRFGGALTGQLILCRYNIGSDLLFIGLAPDGSVATAVSGIPGTTRLVGPLDVVEDVRNGNLYVAEYHERQPGATQITLLRVAEGRTPAQAAAAEVKDARRQADVDRQVPGNGQPQNSSQRAEDSDR